MLWGCFPVLSKKKYYGILSQFDSGEAVRVIIGNIRIVDEALDIRGSVLIEDGIIWEVRPAGGDSDALPRDAALVIDGGLLAPEGRAVLMPALVDMHAHFRDPGFPEKETLESASFAAAAGGYGAVVCMANTKPPLDTEGAVAALKARSDALGLIDLYPVMALTRNMDGAELSGFTALPPLPPGAVLETGRAPRLLSEDGKDLADAALFLAALSEARRLGLPVSCHCDAGGDEAAAAKQAGESRAVWSRIEENLATRRALDLGKRAGTRLHIAHVSTAEAAAMIRAEKAALRAGAASAGGSAGGFTCGFAVSCEATPHHLALTEDLARALGDESHGRVNPPLRTEADRRAILAALVDGTIDAIATDHAPHSEGDKAGGAPGFTGLETAFAAAYTVLVRDAGGLVPSPGIDMRRLSSLMSAAPARLLALPDRGRIAPGLRADLVVADPGIRWRVRREALKSRGKNNPFLGRELWGQVLLTLHRGRIVFDRPGEILPE
jgi:dihydroorotase